jgi:hypothetical protein
MPEEIVKVVYPGTTGLFVVLRHIPGLTGATILNASELKRAVETDSDVRVMHPTPKGDHVWSLDGMAKT